MSSLVISINILNSDLSTILKLSEHCEKSYKLIRSAILVRTLVSSHSQKINPCPTGNLSTGGIGKTKGFP